MNALAPTPIAPPITLSIVSHGHGQMLGALLGDIERGIDTPYHLILTLNITDDESFLAPFQHLPITIIRNQTPQGFGKNHNQAFTHCQSAVFAIINPDIRAAHFSLAPLIAALNEESVGAAGPQIVCSSGLTQDSARRFPTLGSLLKRRLAWSGPDYVPTQSQQSVEWLAGMLIAFKSSAYRSLGGFDENFFMYVEDIDMGWRLRQAGYRSMWVPQIQFCHDAQYGSRKNFQHLWWHVRSMARYFYKTRISQA